MKNDAKKFMKKCHGCQVQENQIQTYPQNLQSMVTLWPFHTWGLDLVESVNPLSNGNIWIFVAIEYFTKRVEAIPLNGWKRFHCAKQFNLTRMQRGMGLTPDRHVMGLSQFA